MLWTPPATREPGELLDAVVAQLAAYGARSWQVALDRAGADRRPILEADAAPRSPTTAEPSPATTPSPGPTRSATVGDSARRSPGPSTGARRLVDPLA